MICYLCTLSARITTRRLRCPACVGGARVVLASRPYGRPGQEGAVPGGYFGANPNCEPASAALQEILLQQQDASHLYAANAEAIAKFAEETGAEVLPGALR